MAPRQDFDSFAALGSTDLSHFNGEEHQPELCYPWNVTPQESRRRQEIGKLIHNIWTGDCGDAGLAEPYIDGRIDVLGLFQMFLFDEYEKNHFQVDNDNDSTYLQIERVHCNELSYDQFEHAYMRPNRPVVIQGLAEQWNASKEWICQRNDKVEPNLAHLSARFGTEAVHVFEQSRAGFTASRPIRTAMTLADYADWWEEHRASSDSADERQLLYLKDWTFRSSHPACDVYRCPHYFREDWLNKATNNAYSFCYVGPKGTSTNLHADVLLSFSWSTNVCGRKQWMLVPPELTFLLYDCFGSTLATHLHSDILDGLDSRFPGLKIARKYAYTLVQEAGETIFVPSKWYHTVQNLDACLSINHNW
jgi:hypothetical protein